MSTINQFAPLPRVPLNSHRTAETTKQPEATTQGHPRTTSHDKAIQMADDLSALLSQFRRRLDLEKRSPNSADPFERILENEAEPKIEKLLFIAHSAEINPQELLLQARAMFPDDSDLILILREMIRRRKLRNENTDVLDEVMQRVWAESNEKLCQAGMNVGFKAQLFAKKMAVTPWALRDTYRQFLSSDEAEVSQYEQWVAQYGSGRRHLVTEFIETALLHDIQSHDPSCSREEFGALLNHMVNFKKLRSSDAAFLQVFLKRKQQKHPKKKEDEYEVGEEVEILSLWFDCLRRPFKIKKELEKNNLAKLLSNINLTSDELQQKIIRAIRLLDAELFFDAKAKDILLEALINNQSPSYQRGTIAS